MLHKSLRLFLFDTTSQNNHVKIKSIKIDTTSEKKGTDSLSSIGTVDDAETKLFIPASRDPSGPPTPAETANHVMENETIEAPQVVESFDDFDLLAGPRKLFDFWSTKDCAWLAPLIHSLHS